MNIEDTALDSSRLALQPTIRVNKDVKEGAVASSEGLGLQSGRLVCHGCFKAHPNVLLQRLEQPRATYQLDSCQWAIDDPKTAQIINSESPPHVGPLDDPHMFKSRNGSSITLF